MTVLSIKSIFLCFSNILLPFVIYLNFQNSYKDDARAKIDVIISNANLLYFILLAMWTVFNLVNLWIKYQVEQETLKKARIETAIKEQELKNKTNETL